MAISAVIKRVIFVKEVDMKLVAGEWWLAHYFSVGFVTVYYTRECECVR
jgi:hypothetical protein